VTNPNDRQIAVKSIDYQLTVAGSDFAQGSSAEPFTVPALGQSEFDLDMVADFGTLLRVMSAHLGDAALEYQVNGHVHLAEGLVLDFPFKGHGQLALR
jgi:LEA14-like dessication related protein